PVLERVAAQIASLEEMFTEHWPSSGALWMPQGRAPQPGELVRNPEYAAVLRDLVAAGEGVGADAADGRADRIEAARERWRTGPVAQAIDEFVRTPHRHSDGADHAGVITREDIAGTEATFERAATASFRGYTI